MRKVLLCTPTRDKPHDAYLDSLEACVPVCRDAGFELSSLFEVGCPYISAARARMLGKGIQAGFDTFVFIDDDVSFTPRDMLRLLQADGEVVAGTYRYKEDKERYMGVTFTGETGRPIVREDGCIRADRVPAGFLRVSKAAVDVFAKAYPELVTYHDDPPSVDIFNHGAFDGWWWGEDYMFCIRYRKAGGEIWLIPDLTLDHNHRDKVYKGNLHEFLMKQPGGKLEEKHG